MFSLLKKFENWLIVSLQKREESSKTEKPYSQKRFGSMNEETRRNTDSSFIGLIDSWILRRNRTHEHKDLTGINKRWTK